MTKIISTSTQWHFIPRYDQSVIAYLNPEELRDCFIEWVQSITAISEGRVVSLDGKRLCNSGSDGKKGFIHMVSTWCSGNNMVMGLVKTDEKSNEITVIPALLELLVLQVAIATMALCSPD